MSSIQLSIADPCHENWNQMLPEEKGRFCLSCQKTVVDFTNMSDGQIFDYFKSYTGNTCGQFNLQQLNRTIAKPKTHSIGRWKYFWQILLPAVFAFHKSNAQTRMMGKVAPKVVCKADSSKPTSFKLGLVATTNYKEPSYRINGTVTDDTGNPIGAATINNGTNYTVTSDNGNFSMPFHKGDVITISYVGYDTKIFTFDSLKTTAIKKVGVAKNSNTVWFDIEIPLKQTENTIDEVVVTSPTDSRQMNIIAGGISYVKINTILPDTVITAISSEPVITIFPNPLHPGQDFKVRVKVKKSGDYFLRITDVSGKILSEQKQTIEKEQNVTVSGAVLQQPGIYLVNVLNASNKKEKELTGKVMVQ